MKLNNQLYNISSKAEHEGKTVYDITLDSEHFIYKSHFPGMPITPGVCILQIARELAEEVIGSALEVDTVKNAKFLAVINPEEDTKVKYTIEKVKQEGDIVSFSSVAYTEEKTFAKISLICHQC